jgi:short-subunit dehydrogenase
MNKSIKLSEKGDEESRHSELSTSSQTALFTGSSIIVYRRAFSQRIATDILWFLSRQWKMNSRTPPQNCEPNTNVEVITCARDLRQETTAQAVFDQFDGRSIEILVNNAGHG